MKKIRIIISLALIICISVTYAFSAGILEKIEVYRNYASLVINGKKVDATTFLNNGTLYLPVKALADAFGARAEWDNVTKTASITLDNNVSPSDKTINYSPSVDALEPVLNNDVLKVDFSKVDAYRLESKGKKVDCRLESEGSSIKILIDTWLDYQAVYILKLFMNDGSRIIINFKTSGLPSPVPGNERKIIFVPAMPEKGFNYPYYMVIPSKINVYRNQGKKNYLFVETHNTGKVGDDLDFHIREAYTIAEGNSAPIAEALGLPRIVPIIVRPESLINGEPVYTHALSRNVIMLEHLKRAAGTYDEVFEPMDRVDRQVVNMIKHANEWLEDNGWEMEDKIFMWGFSASGDFTNRFSFLYPELVKAACFSGFTVLPISEAGGYKMIYPLGTYDYKEITGKEFSLSAYNSVARLFYVGSADTNEPCLMDTPYEREIVENVLAVVEYPDKWPKAKKLFEASGGQGQANVYIGAGHEIFYKGMTKDYMNFFMANREGDTPVYVKPSDPSTTLTDIYSDNIVEVKEPPFSYDKTMITEVFWTGTLPKTLSKPFVEWFKGIPAYNYSEFTLLISIAEWDFNDDASQMQKRLDKVGNELILRAEGYKDVEIFMDGGTITDGMGTAQIYYALVRNPQDMVSGVKYRIIDNTGHWVVMDGVYVERPVIEK